MRTISRIALLCIFPLIPVRIQLANPSVSLSVEAMVDGGDDSALFFLKNFWDYFDSEMVKQGSPGAAVAIVKDNKLIFLKGFGTRKAGHAASEMPVGPNTLFRIGSLSKGFSALLASKLIEEKYFDWDESIQTFLPDFHLQNEEQAGRIAVRHILSHTTGLARHAFTNLTEKGLPLNQILPAFSELEVYGKEGDYFAYQNTAFSMIEDVIAKTTDHDFSEMLDQKIFRPSGMYHASCNFHDIDDYGDVALPHQYWRSRGRYVPIRLNKKYFNAVSAGGINASIGDMAKWLQVLLGNMPKVASEKTLDAIFTPVVETKGRKDNPPWPGLRSASYGMGWRILHFNNRDLVYHGGSVNDYRSEIAIDRKNRIGICILFNAQNRLANEVVPTFFEKYDQYLKDKAELKEFVTS